MSNSNYTPPEYRRFASHGFLRLSRLVRRDDGTMAYEHVASTALPDEEGTRFLDEAERADREKRGER